MQKYIHSLSHYKYQILLTFASIIPYCFYNTFIAPYNNFEYLKNSTFFTVWAPTHLGSFAFYLVPVDYVVYGISKLAGSSLAIDIFYITFLLIAALSSFALIKKVTQHNVISFLCALFYIYGIYGQFVSYWHPINIFFAILPLITLRILSISEKTYILKESILLSFIFFLLIGQNLTFIAYLVFWIFGILVYSIFSQQAKTTIKCISILIVCGVFTTLLSLFYYATYLAQFFYQKSLVNKSLALETPLWKSSSSWLHELLREMGSVNYYYYFHGYSYPNAQPFINNPFLVFLSYIFPFIAFLSFLFYTKRTVREQKLVIFLSSSLIILFFMTMGVFYLSPTRFIYNFFYNHIPYFSVFRDAYKPMLLIHLIYMMLIGTTLLYLEKFKRHWYICVATALCIATIIISYQFWSGTFLRQFTIKIPAYWSTFASYYRRLPQKGTTLLLPDLPFHVYNFTYQHGQNTVFFRPYFNTNVVYEESGSIFDDDIMHTVYTSIEKGKNCAPKLAGFMHIEFLLNQFDQDYRYYQTNGSHIVTPQVAEQMLRSQKDISHIKDFQMIHLYQVNPAFIYDIAYIPVQIIPENGSLCSAVLQSSGANSIAVLPQQNRYVQQNKPDLSVKKFNDAIYTIKISHISSKFLFVLNQRYDNGWKIFTDNSTNISPVSLLQWIFRKPLNSPHIIANFFANGWWISSNTSQINAIVVYMPEIYFYLGLYISGLTACILIFTYGFIIFKKIYEDTH